MTKIVNINLRISQDILYEYTKQAKKLDKKISVQEIIRECLSNSINKNESNSQENFQQELMAKINSELLKSEDDSLTCLNTQEALAKGLRTFNKSNTKYIL